MPTMALTVERGELIANLHEVVCGCVVPAECDVRDGFQICWNLGYVAGVQRRLSLRRRLQAIGLLRGASGPRPRSRVS